MEICSSQQPANSKVKSADRLRRLEYPIYVYTYIYGGYGDRFTSLIPLSEGPSQLLSQLPQRAIDIFSFSKAVCLHCFSTSFFIDLCSMLDPKINPKSIKKQPEILTMRVLFRLCFWLLLNAFPVEQSNTRTLKIITSPWVFAAFCTFSRFQVMQSEYNSFLLLDLFCHQQNLKIASRSNNIDIRLSINFWIAFFQISAPFWAPFGKPVDHFWLKKHMN